MTEKTVYPPQRYEDHIGIIHMQAKLGFKWAQGADIRVEYSDMYQEACVAFVIAAEGYDPETGLKFSTYFTKVAFSQFRLAVGKMTGVKTLSASKRAEIIDRRAENKRLSAAALPQLQDIDYRLQVARFSELNVAGEDGDGMESFVESVASDCETPEQLLEFKQTWEGATSRLSPLAALIVEWLRDPPPKLIAELNRMNAHADLVEPSASATLSIRNCGLRDGLSIKNIGRFIALTEVFDSSEFAFAEAELFCVVQKLDAQ